MTPFQTAPHSEGCVRAVYGAVHGPDIRWGRDESELYDTLPAALEALKSAGSVDWVRQVYGDEVAIHAWEPVCLSPSELKDIVDSLEAEFHVLMEAHFGTELPGCMSGVTYRRLYEAVESAVLEVPYADRAHVQTGTVIVDLAAAQARGWL